MPLLLYFVIFNLFLFEFFQLLLFRLLKKDFPNSDAGATGTQMGHELAVELMEFLLIRLETRQMKIWVSKMQKKFHLGNSALSWLSTSWGVCQFNQYFPCLPNLIREVWTYNGGITGKRKCYLGTHLWNNFTFFFPALKILLEFSLKASE